MRSYPCVFKHRTCGLTIRNWDLSNRELGFTMGHHGSKMRSHRNWCEFDRIVVKALGNLALSKSHGRWIRRQGTTMMNHEQSCRYEPKSEGLKPSDQPICGAMTLSASLNRCLTLSIFQDCQTKETSNAQKFWVETISRPISTLPLGSWRSTIASGREWSPGAMVTIGTAANHPQRTWLAKMQYKTAGIPPTSSNITSQKSEKLMK